MTVSSLCRPTLSSGKAFARWVAAWVIWFLDDFDTGDALGTASACLFHLGPNAHQFIDRSEDFIYGWVGADDEPAFNRVLLLQVVPRPHLMGMMRRRAEAN